MVRVAYLSPPGLTLVLCPPSPSVAAAAWGQWGHLEGAGCVRTALCWGGSGMLLLAAPSRQPRCCFFVSAPKSEFCSASGLHVGSQSQGGVCSRASQDQPVPIAPRPRPGCPHSLPIAPTSRGSAPVPAHAVLFGPGTQLHGLVLLSLGQQGCAPRHLRQLMPAKALVPGRARLSSPRWEALQTWSRAILFPV